MLTLYYLSLYTTSNETARSEHLLAYKLLKAFIWVTSLQFFLLHLHTNLILLNFYFVPKRGWGLHHNSQWAAFGPRAKGFFALSKTIPWVWNCLLVTLWSVYKSKDVHYESEVDESHLRKVILLQLYSGIPFLGQYLTPSTQSTFHPVFKLSR